MTKLLLLSTFVLALAVGPAYAADDATCQQLFEKADVNKDGTVGGPEEVTAFAAAYKASDPSVTTADAELTITKEQFSAACIKDAFKDVALPQ
jgi:hypothetical protein